MAEISDHIEFSESSVDFSITEQLGSLKPAADSIIEATAECLNRYLSNSTLNHSNQQNWSDLEAIIYRNISIFRSKSTLYDNSLLYNCLYTWIHTTSKRLLLMLEASLGSQSAKTHLEMWLTIFTALHSVSISLHDTLSMQSILIQSESGDKKVPNLWNMSFSIFRDVVFQAHAQQLAHSFHELWDREARLETPSDVEFLASVFQSFVIASSEHDMDAAVLEAILTPTPRHAMLDQPQDENTSELDDFECMLELQKLADSMFEESRARETPSSRWETMPETNNPDEGIKIPQKLSIPGVLAKRSTRIGATLGKGTLLAEVDDDVMPRINQRQLNRNTESVKDIYESMKIWYHQTVAIPAQLVVSRETSLQTYIDRLLAVKDRRIACDDYCKLIELLDNQGGEDAVTQYLNTFDMDDRLFLVNATDDVKQRLRTLDLAVRRTHSLGLDHDIRQAMQRVEAEWAQYNQQRSSLDQVHLINRQDHEFHIQKLVEKDKTAVRFLRDWRQELATNQGAELTLLENRFRDRLISARVALQTAVEGFEERVKAGLANLRKQIRDIWTEYPKLKLLLEPKTEPIIQRDQTEAPEKKTDLLDTNFLEVFCFLSHSCAGTECSTSEDQQISIKSMTESLQRRLKAVEMLNLPKGVCTSRFHPPTARWFIPAAIENMPSRLKLGLSRLRRFLVEAYQSMVRERVSSLSAEVTVQLFDPTQHKFSLLSKVLVELRNAFGFEQFALAFDVTPLPKNLLAEVLNVTVVAAFESEFTKIPWKEKGNTEDNQKALIDRFRDIALLHHDMQFSVSTETPQLVKAWKTAFLAAVQKFSDMAVKAADVLALVVRCEQHWESEHNRQFISNLIHMVSSLHDKDVFLARYMRGLCQRLIKTHGGRTPQSTRNIEALIAIEKEIISLIKQHSIGGEMIGRLESVIKDVEQSKLVSGAFKNWSALPVTTEVTIPPIVVADSAFEQVPTEVSVGGDEPAQFSTKQLYRRHVEQEVEEDDMMELEEMADRTMHWHDQLLAEQLQFEDYKAEPLYQRHDAAESPPRRSFRAFGLSTIGETIAIRQRAEAPTLVPTTPGRVMREKQDTDERGEPPPRAFAGRKTDLNVFVLGNCWNDILGSGVRFTPAIPDSLVGLWQAFTDYYQWKYPGRKLNLMAHLSSVNAVIRSDAASQGAVTGKRLNRLEIKLPHLSFVVFAKVFGSQKDWDIRELARETKLSENDIALLTDHSMVGSRSLFQRNKAIQFSSSSSSLATEALNSTSAEEQTCISLNWAVLGKSRINVKMTPMTSQEKQDQSAEIERVEKMREVQVDAAIVRLMKAAKSVSLTDLKIQTAFALSNSFALSSELFKRRIEHLIDKEYLARDNEDFQTLVYLA